MWVIIGRAEHFFSFGHPLPSTFRSHKLSVSKCPSCVLGLRKEGIARGGGGGDKGVGE